MADRLDQNDPVDKVILDRMNAFQTDGSGYLAIQNTRPQTIGYGLVDSPLLQLAWIAEKVHEWTDLPVDRDQLLTTVSLYWLTGSGATAAHTLYEQAHSSDWGAPPDVPQGSRSSARTRRCANWYPPRPTRTGPSSRAASTSRRWRPLPSWPRTLQTFFGPLLQQASGPSTSSGTTAPLAVGPLPMVAVHDVVERAPVGLLDRCERAVGGRAEGDQHGTESVPGKPSRRLASPWSWTPAALPMPRSAAASMMLIVAWPRSNWIRSRIRASSDLGATSAIVAAEPATWPAARHTMASWESCSRSAQTTKSHACWLPADGVRRAASRIRSMSSVAISPSP